MSFYTIYFPYYIRQMSVIYTDCVNIYSYTVHCIMVYIISYLPQGKAMVTGMSSDLGSKPTSDPVANLAIRQCVLNSTGMVINPVKLVYFLYCSACLYNTGIAGVFLSTLNRSLPSARSRYEPG